MVLVRIYLACLYVGVWEYFPLVIAVIALRCIDWCAFVDSTLYQDDLLSC